MERRGLLVAAGGLLAGAGCTTETTEQSSPSNSPAPSDSGLSPTAARDREGYIAAYIVRDVPEDAPVVNLSNESLQDATMVQNVVSDTTKSGKNTTLTLTGDRIQRAQESLSTVPMYSGGGYPAGHHIRHNETTVAVHVAVDE